MPSGRLATLSATAGTSSVLYTCPGGTAKTVVLSICNQNKEDVEVNVARCERDVTTPSDDDYLEYETVMRSKGIIEREVKLAGYQSLIVYSSHSKVTFQVSE